MNTAPRNPVALLFVIFFAIAACSGADQKSQAPNQNEISVFRTGTRMVLVDVVATDSSGKPIRGLQAQDFQLLDQGDQQRVRSFEEHSVDETARPAAEKLPILAPGVYSNWTPQPSSGAVNIVLFDTLNMGIADQAYARMKMVQYLKTLPRGQQMALLTLGDHLKTVQGFTGDTDTLIAAATKVGALSSFQTPETKTVTLDAHQSQPQGGPAQPPPPTTPAPGVHDPSSILQEFIAADVKTMGDTRIRLTLEALRELARTLGSIPGRKNLIWISGDFPLIIGSFTERSDSHLLNQELRATAALLAAHQIAVYPIDSRGLMTGADFSAASVNDGNQSRDKFSEGLHSTHDTMDILAQQTGGRAFYNSNDISGAIGTSIDSGASYYTLAYTPTNKNWDGQLRKIEVKVARQKVKLSYRRGYYAVADPFAPVLKIKTTKVDVQQRLIEAVQPNTPQLSSIHIRANAVATGADKPLEIDYAIDAKDLTLAENEDGSRTVRYQCVVVAWDDADKNAGQAWEMVDKEITAQAASEIRRHGVNSHRFLSLKPGSYHLYLGIIDVESKKIGTLVIPLKVPTQEAALKGADANLGH